MGAYKDNRDGIKVHEVLSARVLFGQHSTQVSPRPSEAEFPSAPSVRAYQNTIGVAWNPPRNLNGITKNVKDYIVRWRVEGEQIFKEEKLQGHLFTIKSTNPNQSYTVQVLKPWDCDLPSQVVALVEEPLAKGGPFIKWIKGREAHTVPTNRKTTTTQLLSNVTQIQKPTRKTLSTLKPPIVTTSKRTLRTSPSTKKPFEEPECGSISTFEKKCAVNSSSTNLRVFDEFDSNYITAFATIFSIMGVILNLLVLVSVINYRVTRKHVR